MSRPRQHCEVCGRKISVKADGTLGGHGWTAFGNGWCKGSHRAPDEIAQIEEAHAHGYYRGVPLEAAICEAMDFTADEYSYWLLRMRASISR